ncbi:MAG: hypothetical protein QF898_07145 [SAR202 cluster bacterium]|nr:hypothetical protein [SAR202 cluster bacterium]MDP6512517.1 hypothetical protein [SAR202 cluster bacterium]MDP6715551.1 hypothetical protein [SAR202 cluster bacterium]
MVDLQRFSDRDASAIKWLLDSGDPSVRHLTLVDILDVPEDSEEVQPSRDQINEGPKVRALLARQQGDGDFGVGPYTKWAGAHWRLVSLAELGIPAGEPRAVAAFGTVLDWLDSDAHNSRIVEINGLWRQHASQEGNALFVGSRLGMGDSPRVRRLAESLVTWQWPDGGWNCRQDPDGHHSSFFESITPLKGLIEYRRFTGQSFVEEAIERGAEFFLQHGMFRSERTGEVIRKSWLDLRYPQYWHYDILHGLGVLAPLGKLEDERAQEALDILESKRLPDGRWRPKGYHWRRTDAKGSLPPDVVDWGRGAPNEMLTLNAVRVLKASGRLA